MIFVPLSANGLHELLHSGALGATAAFTATPALHEDLGYGPSEDEDADFAAFRYASIQAVAQADGSGRIVVAADVPAGDLLRADGDRFGRVTARRVRQEDVTAVYLDEDAARPAVAAARPVVAEGVDLGEVTEAPAVVTLLDEHAMLWHLPAEVAD